MKQIAYLEADDIIQEGDFMRPLDLVYEGQSDYLATSSCYTGSPMNHTRWCQVERAGIPFWIGKTVGEFNDTSFNLGRHSTETTAYEFVRGDIPAHAILQETEAERERRVRAELDTKVLTFGKYRNQTVAQIRRHDPSYIEFCLREGYLKEPT